jgi:hypothetical protein
MAEASMASVRSRGYFRRLAALEVANDVRAGRTALRQAVQRGEVTVSEILLDLPACVARMPVNQLLQWAPSVGWVRARALLRPFVVSPDMEVRAIDLATRKKVAGTLEARAKMGTVLVR